MSDVPSYATVSKVKEYLKSKHDLRTSAKATDPLNKAIQALLDDAASKAKAAKRKTVQEEDFVGCHDGSCS